MVHAMLEGIMKKATQDDVLEAVSRMTLDQARAIMVKIIRSKLSPSTRTAINEAIMGCNDRPVAPIGEDRAIPLKELEELAGNREMTEIIPLIIMAAMNRPMQTGELMAFVMTLAGKKLFYFTPEGISKKHKAQVGYILSMAGFERRSHYSRDTQKPVKAWKPSRATGDMALNLRVDMVKSILNEYTGKEVAQPLVNHLEDLV